MEPESSFVLIGLALPLTSLLAVLGGAYFTNRARKNRMASLDAVALEMFKTLEKQPARANRSTPQKSTATG